MAVPSNAVKKLRLFNDSLLIPPVWALAMMNAERTEIDQPSKRLIDSTTRKLRLAEDV